MECPICLEQMELETLVGQVDPCKHYYHSQCIEKWTSQSNSCPTCRNLFYRVDVLRVCNKRVISSFRVQNKLAENAAIDEIPPEYVLPAGSSTDFPYDSQPSGLSGVCIICSSSQYSMSPMFSCIACGGAYHSQCLGYRQEGYWFCPVCECRMERAEFRAHAKHEDEATDLDAGRTHQAVHRERSKRCQGQSSSPLSSRWHHPRAPRKSFHTSSAQLSLAVEPDDYFSDDDDSSVQVTSSVRARVLENGGVRLRRQARELQQLSSEEAQAWQMLENARHGIEASFDAVPAAPKVHQKKRVRAPILSRQHLSEPENGNISSIDPVSAAQPMSRIGSLIKQIQSRGSHGSEGSAQAPIEISDPLKDEAHGTRAGDSSSGVNTEDKKVFIEPKTGVKGANIGANTEPKINPREFRLEGESESKAIRYESAGLSLEQKKLVQNHVRRHLRRYYQKADAEGGQPPICSEQEYIAVNKTLSRRIYKRILAHEPGRYFSANPQLLHDLCRLCWTEFQADLQTS